MHRIRVIDSHTGGEPTRVVVDGVPLPAIADLALLRETLRRDHDHWRSAIACEPRGSDTMVGAYLLPPRDADVVAGVVFFNNVGYLGMCGHGAIGVVRTLAHLGRITAGRHRLDTPVGRIEAELHEDGSVAIDNVESWREHAGVEVDLPGFGRIHGDVAWGGNWFFITGQTPCELRLENWRELTTWTAALRDALDRAGIRGRDGAEIDHIEINTTSPIDGVDGRNFVLCPGLAWDRSPCGTGTSAKLACLAADGKLAEGARWRQESLIGSVFDASWRRSPRGVLPRIVGSAHVSAEATLLIEPGDPFAWGIR